MGKERKAGMVSLQSAFEDLERVEEIIQGGEGENSSEDIKRGLSILKGIKEELDPLVKEKDAVELELVMEDIELAIEILSNSGRDPKALEAMNSAKLNLTEYNLRGRK